MPEISTGCLLSAMFVDIIRASIHDRDRSLLYKMSDDEEDRPTSTYKTTILTGADNYARWDRWLYATRQRSPCLHHFQSAIISCQRGPEIRQSVCNHHTIALSCCPTVPFLGSTIYYRSQPAIALGRSQRSVFSIGWIEAGRSSA